MKKILCLATVVLLATFAFSQIDKSTDKSDSSGQSHSMSQNAGSPDEQQLLAIEQQWADAMKSGNTAAVQRIEADNYVMSDSNGMTVTKQQDVDALKSGQEKYTQADLSDLKANVNGDTATVTGKITLKGIEKGKDINGTYQFTDTFQKNNGTWQAVSTKSEKVPQ